MKLEILGCSGGIGAGLKTTSMLINDQWLLDAGTGVELLSHERMRNLKGVLLTHAHLDHLCCLPLLLPVILDSREQPFRIYASATVLDALKSHFFNWVVWPDFTQLPTADTSVVKLLPIEPEQQLELDGLSVTPLAVNHPSPTQGYMLSSGESAIVFTGDCYDSAHFWRRLSQESQVKQVLVDVSFPESYQEIADASGHYTPQGLLADLAVWPESVSKPIIGISHLKPGLEQQVLDECVLVLKDWPTEVLRSGDVLTF